MSNDPGDPSPASAPGPQEQLQRRRTYLLLGGGVAFCAISLVSMDRFGMPPLAFRIAVGAAAVGLLVGIVVMFWLITLAKIDDGVARGIELIRGRDAQSRARAADALAAFIDEIRVDDFKARSLATLRSAIAREPDAEVRSLMESIVDRHKPA